MFGLFVLDTLFNFRGQCVHCVAYCSTSTLAIRKESSDSSHECIILDIIHHVLIKNICTCAV